MSLLKNGEPLLCRDGEGWSCRNIPVTNIWEGFVVSVRDPSAETSLIQILQVTRGSQALNMCVAAAAGAGSQLVGTAAPPSIPNIPPQRCTART